LNAQLCRRLFDARGAARRIETLTSALSIADYAGNDVLRLAVERLFEILGEALAAVLRLDPDLEGEWPDLRRAVPLCNRIIHGYDHINDVVIWDIVRTNLPPLILTIDTLLVTCDEEMPEQQQ
jgi:uncharacterized protein with HEPN domain